MKKLRRESRMLVEFLDTCNDKLKLIPSDITSIRVRSVVYTAAELYDKAIADLNVVIKGSKDDLSAYYLRGDCYFNQGEYDLAKRDYLRALKIQFKDDTEFSQGYTEEIIAKATMDTEEEKKIIQKVLEHEKKRVVLSYFPGLK